MMGNREGAAHVADRPPIVLAEVGNGLEVWHQASRQPHDLDVALRLALQPAAGLDPVQVSGRDSSLPSHPPLEPGMRVSPHPAQASAKPLLQGPTLQRQTSGVKLTVAIRMEQDQISVVVCSAFTLGDSMVDIPPRLLGDQLVA